MAVLPRRFRIWPHDNLTGLSRLAAYGEGVMFTDGTIAIRYTGAIPTSVVYPDRGIDAIEAGHGFAGSGQIEWIDY